MTKFLVAFASVALAGTAIAQTSQPRQEAEETENSQAQQTQEQGKNERLICRRLAPAATGSAMGHRRCLTAAQWRAINARR
jgi:hypothetical protein